MPLDKSPLVVKEFKGKLATDLDFGADKYEQTEVPFEFSLDNENVVFLKKGGIRTRDGLEKYVEQLNVTGIPIQAWKITNLAGIVYTDRWLIGTRDGAGAYKLYDTQVAAPATNPILSISANYLTIINAFDRIYISPLSAWNIPLDRTFSEFTKITIWVYNGKYNARFAAGVPPILGAFAAVPAAGGNCTPGLHICSVIYETDTGFLTGFNSTGVQVTTTGANGTINFTNIPVGGAGAGIAKRHIVISKIVVNDNGQGLKGYEPFICVDIDDNTTTTASFSQPDSALVDSAKDLLDAPSYLVPCVAFATYGNRLVYIQLGYPWAGDFVPPGGYPRYHYTAFSPANKPEQLSEFEAFSESQIPTSLSVKNIGPDFSGFCTAGAEINKIFYIFKEDSTFSIIADDELDPAEWEDPALVDGGKGAYPRAVAKIGNNPGYITDGAILVAGNHGLTYFNGVFAQRSLSEGILEVGTVAELKFVRLAVDPIRQLIFIVIGDPFTTTRQQVFVANYYYGVDIASIRWGQFSFVSYLGVNPVYILDVDLRKSGTPGAVGPANISDTQYPLLTILSRRFISGNNYDAYIFSEAKIEKDWQVSNAPGLYPTWKWETGYTPNKEGSIYTFGPLTVRMTSKGVSETNIEKARLDSIIYSLVARIVPGQAPGKYFSANLSEDCEQIRLRFSGINRTFLQMLVLHMVEKYKERPRV